MARKSSRNTDILRDTKNTTSPKIYSFYRIIEKFVGKLGTTDFFVL